MCCQSASNSSAAIIGSEVYMPDRKSTRLNSSHASISYAVFSLKKKAQFARLRLHGPNNHLRPPQEIFLSICEALALEGCASAGPREALTPQQQKDERVFNAACA